jgi:two-component system cell cycle response regulator
MTQHPPGTPAAQPLQGDAPSKKDQRKNPRRRVLKEGKLVFGKGQCVVDCTIDYMSDGGAHVRMISSHDVPHDFYLVEANRGIIHKAEVAWRTATGIGLRLLGPLEDVAAREALMRKFRRG